MNHTTNALTVSTTQHGEHGTVEPGGFFGFKTEPGSYHSVAGYPQRAAPGDVRRRSGRSRDDRGACGDPLWHPTDHRPAHGPAGGAVGSRPARRAAAFRRSPPSPAGGRWRLTVAPRITTTYQIAFAGDQTDGSSV